MTSHSAPPGWIAESQIQPLKNGVSIWLWWGINGRNKGLSVEQEATQMLLSHKSSSASHNAPCAQSSLSLDYGDRRWYWGQTEGAFRGCWAGWLASAEPLHVLCFSSPIPSAFQSTTGKQRVCVCVCAVRQGRPHTILSCVCLYTYQNHSTDKDSSVGLKRLHNLKYSYPSRYWFFCRENEKTSRDDTQTDGSSQADLAS